MLKRTFTSPSRDLLDDLAGLRSTTNRFGGKQKERPKCKAKLPRLHTAPVIGISHISSHDVFLCVVLFKLLFHGPLLRLRIVPVIGLSHLPYHDMVLCLVLFLILFRGPLLPLPTAPAIGLSHFSNEYSMTFFCV